MPGAVAEEYVIIRVRRAPRRRRRGLGFDPGDAPTDAEMLGVNVVTSQQALADAQADPDVKASGRSMPMQLIAPVSIKEIRTEPTAAAPASKVAWGVQAVGADTSPFDGTNVVVAVLDTGIDRNHPAFKGVELIEKDFTGDGDGDKHGHGTHCAGTIFGRDVDGVRIGIARGVTRALIGKVIGRSGGSSAGIASAINWAVENNANVISMSLGIDFPGYQAVLQRRGMRPEPATSLALEAYRQNLAVFDSISELVESLARFRQPCLLIAAAGNESRREEVPPYDQPTSGIGGVYFRRGVAGGNGGVDRRNVLEHRRKSLGTRSGNHFRESRRRPGVYGWHQHGDTARGWRRRVVGSEAQAGETLHRQSVLHRSGCVCNDIVIESLLHIAGGRRGHRPSASGLKCRSGAR